MKAIRQEGDITFVDTQFRASGFGPYKAELPMIPGNGVGGVVTSVGTGADEELVGKRVVSSTGGSGGKHNNYFEGSDLISRVAPGRLLIRQAA